jgi:DNA-binding transcriptional ArsR family regulator
VTQEVTQEVTQDVTQEVPPARSPVAALAALADETRWAVLEALADDDAVGSGGLTASALAGRLPVTRQAIAKHLAVLEAAGLVESQMVGRERRYRALGAELTALGRRLERIGDAWEARLVRIASIAEDLERG